MISILLALSLAHGGDLSTGMLGYTWGPMPDFPKPTVGSCAASPVGDITWVCTRNIGTVPVTVRYFRKYGVLYGIGVYADSGNCPALWDTLIEAWGQPRPKYDSLTTYFDPHTWMTGSAFAVWEANRYMSTCTALAFHVASYEAVRDRDRGVAAEAAKEL